MTTDLLLRQLAGAVQEQHPLAYCCACLAQRLGVDEGKVRDTAQMLLVRQRQRFVLARHACAGCRETDHLLIYVRSASG